MNQSKVKHTETPYKVARVFVENSPDEFHIVDKLFVGIHHAIACDEETANEFVAKLNAHDALVKVVELASDFLRSVKVFYSNNTHSGAVASQLESALKLAKGGAE